VQPTKTPMKFANWLLFIAGTGLLVVNIGCASSNSGSVDNSAALHSIGSAPDESTDYQPPRSPSQEDPFKGSR
jgi:hypothetical protein